MKLHNQFYNFGEIFFFILKEVNLHPKHKEKTNKSQIFKTFSSFKAKKINIGTKAEEKRRLLYPYLSCHYRGVPYTPTVLNDFHFCQSHQVSFASMFV